jgi:hypothetical protein
MCCGHKRSQFQSNPLPRRRASRFTPANAAMAVAPVPIAHGPVAPMPGGVRPAVAKPDLFGQRPPAHAVGGVPRGHPPLANVQPSPLPPGLSHRSISVRYLNASPIRVRGHATGRHYEFSAASPVQSVDARDATSLFNTRLFRRA